MDNSVRRVIIIDDNPEIHRDFHSILGKPEINEELDNLESELFGTTPASHNILTPEYELYYASQGQEGVAIVSRHHKNNIPFHLAFVDMRMPPGWDGLETIEKMWEIDSSIQVVICTAFSDYSWTRIIERLGNPDNLLILKKPFEIAEVVQIARTLTGKWLLAKKASESDDRVKKLQNQEPSLQPITEKKTPETNESPELLENLSREIRTPMTGIIGMTELILQTELSEVQRDYLEIVRTSGESLLGIVNDILDYSKLEDGKMQLSSLAFNLRHTIENVMETVSLKAYRKGIELIGNIGDDIPEIVKGDPGKLRQIFLTLMGNAIKNSEKGKIIISAQLEKTLHKTDNSSESFIYFSIEDTGSEVPEEKFNIIFGDFTSAQLTEQKDFNSSDFGLTIARKLIEMCKGELKIRSNKQKGSVFNFTLPLQIAKEDHPEVFPRISLTDKSILVIRENTEDFNIVICFLEHFKIHHETVSSEESGLKILQKRSFDMIIFDTYVSSQRVFETSKRLVEKFHIPLILITSSGKLGDASMCLENGISAYLIKPMLLSTFQKTLIRAFSSKPFQKDLITRHTIDEYERKEWELYSSRQKVKLKILLAEDDIVNRMLIKAIISKTNHSLEIVENGREAVEMFQQNNFDLILMDISMPEMDGIEATRLIREEEKKRKLKKTPIIAITAHSFKQNRTEAMNAGMDDYISKPIYLSKLLTIIDKHLPPFL